MRNWIRNFIGIMAAAIPAHGQLAKTNDLAQAYNRLGFHLLAECRKAAPDKNYFLSPASLGFALSMLQNGAGGETAQQIKKTLNVSQFSLNELNAANKSLFDYLNKLDPQVKLEIANSIWVDQRMRVKPEFITVNKNNFDAEVANQDFHDPSAAKVINQWVSDKTHGKITSMVEPPLNPMLRMILLNAVYFKGAWVSTFPTNATASQSFTLANGTEISHSRMNRKMRSPCYETDAAQILELPYVGGVSMVVVLPRKPLDEFLKAYTLENFESDVANLHPVEVIVGLPRFKMENEYILTKDLQAMGMPLAFDPKADFSALSDSPMWIDFVKQKTYVDVNEQGTEAAAVTGIGVRAMVARREPQPVNFIVDRPFLVAIREQKTGLILFLGAICDPR